MCVKSLFFLLLNNILLYGYTLTCLSLGSYFYYEYSCFKYFHMSLYTHAFIYLEYLRIVRLYDKCMYTFRKPSFFYSQTHIQSVMALGLCTVQSSGQPRTLRAGYLIPAGDLVCAYWGTMAFRVSGNRHQLSSVAQSCPTPCDPMDCSPPGLPVHHQLLEPPQTHVPRVSDDIQPIQSSVAFSSRLQSFPASGSFPMSQSLTSGGQSIGVSVSASVIPMNIQD